MAARLVEHQLGDIRLVGYSLAGEETVIAAPELNACFDIGRAPPEVLPIDHVFLSHGHMDHSAGIAYYYSQRNFVGNAAGCIACPHPLVEPIRELMRVWGRIEGHPSPFKVVGMDSGDEYVIRKGLVARAFAINHRAPSLGFVLVDIRHKLKPEFAGLSGPQIVELKKKGIEIQYSQEVPLVAYCGDTAEGAWMENELVCTAKVLILECTFFEADHVKRAREGHHLHVRDVARILPKMKNEHFLLHHVTRRTSIHEAKRSLRALLPAEVQQRVTFLMDWKRPGPAAREPSPRRADEQAGQEGESPAEPAPRRG